MAPFIGLIFVDDTNIETAANDACTSSETMFEQIQALMTDWSKEIKTTGGLIAPTKTR